MRQTKWDESCFSTIEKPCLSSKVSPNYWDATYRASCVTRTCIIHETFKREAKRRFHVVETTTFVPHLLTGGSA